MLFAPTAAKHDLTATAAVVGGLKKNTNNCGDANVVVAKNKHQAAAAVLLTNGLRRLNHHHQQQQQQSQQHHNREHHNQQQQQQQQKQQQQQQQSQCDKKVKQQQQEQQQTERYLQQSHHVQIKQQQQQLTSSSTSPSPSEARSQQQQHHQQQLTMEAIKKFDTKLAAYLAGEKKLTSLYAETGGAQAAAQVVAVELVDCPNGNEQRQIDMEQPENQQQQVEQLFKHISGIKLQMEALTLQPEGTKRMELLQNDLRPIFTVECQLSHELIKDIPRYDMFHIMQFESEKFHSLTQCTRFGQEAERAVKLQLQPHDNANDNYDDDAVNNNNNSKDDASDAVKGDKLNFGRIHFTVWWREPGTCLNEMLGMGVLHLKELYEASVLEQCKRIIIQRRKVHLANLYFKIGLQIGAGTGTGTETGIATAAASMEAIAGATTTTAGGSNSDNVDDTMMMMMTGGGNKLNASDKSQTDPKTSGNAGTNNSENDDNNVQIETTHFIAETSLVRLLRGLIYAGEVRQLDLNENQDYLVCRRFWEDDLAVTIACPDNKFNYQEQFAVLNDDAFLRRVKRQYLHLEIWRRNSLARADGNGNDSSPNTADIRPMGVVRLPLHQFFIAYRDVALTNHLRNAKLPVVSFDAWAPITRYTDTSPSTPIGELRCMLAIGSDEQISALKEAHGYFGEPTSELQNVIAIDKKLFLQSSFTPIGCGAATTTNSATPQHQQQQQQQPELRSTANLLEFLQRSLITQPPNAAPPPPRMPPEATTSAIATATATGTATGVSALPPTLLKPLQAHTMNVKSFRFLLIINRAYGLPRNPNGRGKKSSKSRNSSSNKQQRFPPNEAPSTYVTFQADEGYDGGPVYKSHEGEVYATNIVEKSTQPQWQQRFRICASVDYLLNPQKRFILKIWKKAATDSPQKRQQPTPLDDAIVGFAALDLTVFMRGLHLAGCYNIVDFNGRINGQLEIRSQPLEDLKQLLVGPYQYQLHSTASTTAATSTATATGGLDASTIPISGQMNIDNFIDDFDNVLELNHLNLGQAIKRKFTELEGISQRLRTRLVDVTGEQLPTTFNPKILDAWQADQDNNTIKTGDFDEFDEFEHDINTAPATPPPPPPPQTPTPSTSTSTSSLSLSLNPNRAAQNDGKAQFMIASIASPSNKANVEHNDPSNSMTPKE